MFNVTVEKEGFPKVLYEKVELVVGAKQSLEVSLKLGSGRETVTVTEEPPLIELTRSDMSNAVEGLDFMHRRGVGRKGCYTGD